MVEFFNYSSNFFFIPTPVRDYLCLMPLYTKDHNHEPVFQVIWKPTPKIFTSPVIAVDGCHTGLHVTCASICPSDEMFSQATWLIYTKNGRLPINIFCLPIREKSRIGTLYTRSDKEFYQALLSWESVREALIVGYLEL